VIDRFSLHTCTQAVSTLPPPSRRSATALALALLTFALPAVAPAATAPDAIPAVTLAPDAAWCWFGNPRALRHRGILYFGYVRAIDGKTCLSAHDPATGATTLLWTSTWSQLDDHNNPALTPLADGRLLAVYAAHSREPAFYWRLSTSLDPATPSAWTEERAFTDTPDRVCYANPYQLVDERGLVFNFTRNLNFNPTRLTFDPVTDQWSSPSILIQTGTGATRPYVQYASDYRHRIDLLYTDGHPLRTENSLYHLYYSGGAWRRSDGVAIKQLSEGPLLHDPPHRERGSVVYPYLRPSDQPSEDQLPGGRAWCWDLAYAGEGSPVCVFSVQRDHVTSTHWHGDRIAYFYARWTGDHWERHLIAQAGRPLYEAERDYAGGITLDPAQPSIVYLSSNALHPFQTSTSTTDLPLQPNARYELYRGLTRDGGRTFTWQALTSNSAVDQLRPYVPRNQSSASWLLWLRGRYRAYTDWSTELVGHAFPLEQAPP